MREIKIHVLHCGSVCVSPHLPYGSYSSRSWREMIRPGISADPETQMRSLDRIRQQCLDPDCIEALANHDADVIPHTITL